MKIYVMTGAKPFCGEVYIGVKKNIKEAEKALRTLYPHMKPSDSGQNQTRVYVSDVSKKYLLFIHEEEL